MKKIIPILISSFLLIFLGQIASAQSDEFPSPGLTPDSPFYFFDTLGEKIGMFITFGADKKAKRALQYAEEKLAEAKVMAGNNKNQALGKAAQKYQEFLELANQNVEEAKEEGKDVDELAALIFEKTAQHQEVLAEVLERVSEEAKTVIKKAIEVSRKGSEKALQAVSGDKKQELIQKILIQKIGEQKAKTESGEEPKTEEAPEVKESNDSERQSEKSQEPTTLPAPPPAPQGTAPSPPASSGISEIAPVAQPSPAPVLIDGKTLQERLTEAYDRLHTRGSGQHIRDSFPDIELVYTDDAAGMPFPREITPFRYYYSREADTTFSICAIELTTFICKGKLDKLIQRENVDSGQCNMTFLYSGDPRL